MTSLSSRQSVLITGASKGIGRAIALQAAQAGYDLVLHYGRDKASAEQTQKEALAIGIAHNINCRLLSFDISDRQTCKEVLENDINQNGAYYGVVLNAGIAKDNAFPALTDDEWDQVIHTNLHGFYNVLKPLIMPMVRRRAPGRIITLSSVSGMIGNRGQVNYSASKGGIISATKALAIELAKRQITVNCVAPGAIETEMTAHLEMEHLLPMIPMNRLGRPEEVAATVVFLLSESAAYITRQVISVNGGLI